MESNENTRPEVAVIFMSGSNWLNIEVIMSDRPLNTDIVMVRARLTIAINMTETVVI